MTIRLTRRNSTGLAVSMMAGMFVLVAASHSHAANRAGGARANPAETIVYAVQGRVDSSGRLFRPPTTVKPPPGARVRDNRGDVTKFVGPTCGHHPRPCKLPRK